MAMTKMSAFTFLHSSQVDALYTVYTATQIKTFFDSQATELKNYVNNVLTEEIDSDLSTKAELAAAVLSGISDNTITSVKLVDKTIETGKIADDTITTLNLATTLKSIQFYGKYSQFSGGDAHSGSASAGKIAFTTEDRDDFLAINIPTSATKITIPSGVTRVKLYLKCGWSCYGGQQTSSLNVYLYKNNSSIETLFTSGAYYDTNSGIFYIETRLSASAGDYFEIYVAPSTNQYSSSSISAGAVFGMEAIG